MPRVGDPRQHGDAESSRLEVILFRGFADPTPQIDSPRKKQKQKQQQQQKNKTKKQTKQNKRKQNKKTTKKKKTTTTNKQTNKQKKTKQNTTTTLSVIYTCIQFFFGGKNVGKLIFHSTLLVFETFKIICQRR